MTDAVPGKPNYVKQSRYARSHERLKLALEHGFFIEAAMICESFISDRLHSHLHWRAVVSGLTTWDELYGRLSAQRRYKNRPPQISLDESAILFILIEAVKLDFDDFGSAKYAELPKKLHKWRGSRNELAHQILYTVPTKKTYNQEFESFMQNAGLCALDGRELVRHLTNWDRMARGRLLKGMPL